jgi:hypothetical protein
MKHTMALAAGIALLAACADGKVATDTSANFQLGGPAASQAGLGADINKDLAKLRSVTAAFHDSATASRAGWSTQITKCMTDPVLGGMGFHYGNTALINGTATVENPQLLLYEPDKNGKVSLVAVEYIIPYSFHSRDAEPPVLFNQKFQQVDSFQLWGLHAWVWKDNPSGMFAPWNPNVNCDNTTEVMSMSM